MMPHGLKYANYLNGSKNFSRFNIVKGNQQTRSNVAQGRERCCHSLMLVKYKQILGTSDLAI